MVKYTQMLKTAFDWLVKSSADPAKFSRTLKGGIPFLVLFFGWQGVDENLLQPLLNDTADVLAGNIALFAQIITGLVGLYGLGAKIVNTIKNKTA